MDVVTIGTQPDGFDKPTDEAAELAEVRRPTSPAVALPPQYPPRPPSSEAEFERLTRREAELLNRD